MPVNFNTPDLGTAPVQTPITDENRMLTPQWQAFFSLNSALSRRPVILDTHTNRINVDPNVRPYYGPGQFLQYLFVETDRAVLYAAKMVGTVPAWVYIAGTMRGTLAARPAGLGANDAGFLYNSTDGLDYRWDGAGWVTLDTIRGGLAMIDVNQVPKIGPAAGQLKESAIKDDGTQITTTEKVGILQPAPGYSLDVGGDINTAGVFRAGGTGGAAGSVTLAKLTAGGTTGSIVFSAGIITTFVQPT